MPLRQFTSGSGYRYGFNGKEEDDEVKGNGNQQDYGMRIYDPRLGRFLSVDPLHKKYPELTPYQFAGNTPIQAIDLDGLEPVKPLSVLKKAWYYFTGDAYIVQATEFAVENKIDQKHFYVHTVFQPHSAEKDEKDNFKNQQIGYRSTVVIYNATDDKKTGDFNESKSVFRKNGKNDINVQWDNYWDDQGNPILWNEDLGDGYMDAPVPGGSNVARGFMIAGASSKTWSIYQFLDKSSKLKQYTGLTVDYMRRISQHAGRVLSGSQFELINKIPNKKLARGIEQLFIEYGRKAGEIANEINSINPKRKDYSNLINNAVDYLKKNHSEFDFLWKNR